MTRLLLSLILLTMASCGNCFAGYSIIVRDQVTPATILVQRGDSLQARRNPGPPPVYPATATRLICRVPGFSLYSSAASRRTEVWEDSAGTAASPELFAVCPQIRLQVATAIRSEGSRRLSALAAPYQPAERETWTVQHREAEEWILNADAPVPMIRAIAAGRGVSVADLVRAIMENVALFRTVSGMILGQQQFLLDWVDREPDFATLLGISWEP